MSVLRQSSARRPSSSLTVVWHRIAVRTGDGMAEGPSLCQHDHESVTHKNSMIVEPVMTRRSTAGPREAGRTVSVIHEMVIRRSFGPSATDKQTEPTEGIGGQTTSVQLQRRRRRARHSHSVIPTLTRVVSRCGPSRVPSKSLLSTLIGIKETLQVRGFLKPLKELPELSWT